MKQEKQSPSERFGLWLAWWALRITGNRELANISRVAPLIRRRRFAIG
jgi:predicted AAA+ superfamily ATPase